MNGTSSATIDSKKRPTLTFARTHSHLSSLPAAPMCRLCRPSFARRRQRQCRPLSHSCLQVMKIGQLLKRDNSKVFAQRYFSYSFVLETLVERCARRRGASCSRALSLSLFHSPCGFFAASSRRSRLLNFGFASFSPFSSSSCAKHAVLFARSTVPSLSRSPHQCLETARKIRHPRRRLPREQRRPMPATKGPLHPLLHPSSRLPYGA